MTFHDLPDNWPDLPLTEPRLVADVLDLVVTEASRSAGALYLLLCDEQDRLMQPCVVDDLPAECDVGESERVLQVFVDALGAPDRSLLVVLAAPDPAAADHRWSDVARRVCGHSDVRLLGVYLVTPTAVHRLDPGERAA